MITVTGVYWYKQLYLKIEIEVIKKHDTNILFIFYHQPRQVNLSIKFCNPLEVIHLFIYLAIQSLHEYYMRILNSDFDLTPVLVWPSTPLFTSLCNKLVNIYKLKLYRSLSINAYLFSLYQKENNLCLALLYRFKIGELF